MAVRRNGVTDEFIIIDEETDTDVTSELGPLQNFSWTISKNTEKEGSIGQQPEFVDIVDGVVDIEADLTVDAPDLDVLEVLGVLQDNPKDFTVKTPVVTETGEEETMEITGIKFEASMEISDGEVLGIDFTGIGLEVQTTSETLDTPTPDNTKPVSYLDVDVEIDGEQVEAADSFSIDFTRNLSAERGIKPVSSEEQRPFNDVIIPGMKDYSGTLDFQVTNDMATKLFFDDTGEKSFTGSQRSLINDLKFFDRKNSKALVIPELQFDEIGMTQDTDTETRIISTPFEALNATIEEVTE